MSKDDIPRKNAEGYNDPTAAAALKNLQRSQSGMQSKRAGEFFENLIGASLRWYEINGLACVEKTPEPMKPLRAPNQRGQFLACYVKSGQPDFKGTLTGGRSIVFEAKHTSREKIDASRLTDEQVKQLDMHHKLGAVAFVLVGFGLQDFYRIPWEVWHDMENIYGYKHMKQQDCEPYRVHYVNGVLKLLEDIELRYNEREKTP